MKGYTSFEIIDKIIGHISSVGETNYDSTSLENLDEVGEVVKNYISTLVDNANDRNSPYASVSDIGNKSYTILKDIIEMIDDLEEEEKWR